MPEEKSLYDQLGGRAAISAVVNRLYELIAKDPSVAGFFTETGMPAHSLTEFLVIASGGEGDPNYQMPDLASVHKPHGITDEAFDTVARYLTQALNEFNVPQPTIDAVITLVASTRGQIVSQ